MLQRLAWDTSLQRGACYERGHDKFQESYSQNSRGHYSMRRKNTHENRSAPDDRRMQRGVPGGARREIQEIGRLRKNERVGVNFRGRVLQGVIITVLHRVECMSI